MRKDFPILFNLGGLFRAGKISADVDLLENSILLSMLYLSHNVNENGRFTYRNSTDESKVYSDKHYSSLRHAGTLYSMILCENLINNSVLKRKRLFASEYLIKNYVKRVDDTKYAIVSKPYEESPVLVATSGGTGLGLIALCGLVSDGFVRLTTLQKMGNFLVYMLSKKGEFWASYEYGKKSKSNVYYARYYAGQASLGLLHLWEVDKNQKWLKTAKKSLLHQAEKTEKIPDVDMKFDHWGVIAIKKLFEIEDNKLKDEERAALLNYVTKNVKGLLCKHIFDKEDGDIGSFDGVKSLCTTAMFMEGLVASCYLLEDKKLQKNILKSLKIVSEYLTANQVKVGKMEGGVPTNPNWNTPTAEFVDKEIRIDNIQHALSAWVTYRKLLSELNK